MKVYGLKACDTTRKAVKALSEQGRQVELVDVRSDPLDREALRALLAEFGSALLNTRSTTWRGLDEAERQRDPVDLLHDHPALMKRPVIEDAGNRYLGWTREVQATFGIGTTS